MKEIVNEPNFEPNDTDGGDEDSEEWEDPILVPLPGILNNNQN